MLLRKSAVLALTTSAAFSPQLYLEEVAPVVMVSESSMPKRVPEELSYVAPEEVEAVTEEVAKPICPAAVVIYSKLKDEFGISHTEMSKWLDVTRRSLYNWKDAPENATKVGPQIEKRLFSLSALKDEMEPEHRPLLFKIAFSPIYGDPELGNAILAGASGYELVERYDSLFSKFEAYRSVLTSNAQMV